MICSVQTNLEKIHVASVNMHLSSLVVQVLITKENLTKQAHPFYGDLVVFEYEKKKQSFQKVFAYVTNMRQTVITSFTTYNKDLGKWNTAVHIALFNDVIFKQFSYLLIFLQKIM